MEELKKEYEKVIAEINILEARKLKLEQEMIIQSSDFMEKFRIWYKNDDDGYHRWIVNSPILRKLLDNIDPRRGETIDLDRLIGYDEFEFLLSPEDYIDDFETPEDFKIEYDKTLEQYQPALQEAMDTNMKSFKCDW